MTAIRTRVHAGAMLAIVLLAINFRTVFASLPPLVSDVRDDRGLSAIAAGLLTALAVLSFGLLPAVAVGYLIASTGPWILGLAHDPSGGWTVPLLVMLAASLAQLPAGLRATGDRLVAGAEAA